MLASQKTKPQCRKFTGPTPHSGAMRERLSSSRPPEHVTLGLDRRRREDARDQLTEIIKYQQTCDLRTTWEKTTDRRIILGTIDRRVKDAMVQYEIGIDERRDRLRTMLEAEEQEHLMELEGKQETVLDKQARMRERVSALRERRESERQQLVADKLEQRFREESEELRTVGFKRRQDEVCTERAAQIQDRREMCQQQQEEERLFAGQWDDDRRAKEERESRALEKQRRGNQEQLGHLRAQMEAAEEQRRQAKQLKEEEAQLLRERRETLRLEEQREQHQKLQSQEARRRQLDRGMRLKMKRLAREQQDELVVDMGILQQLLAEGADEKQLASEKKIELREKQQKYHRYLAEELEVQKREEAETGQLVEAELDSILTRREQKSHVEREARNRLMKDVMETRRLQIQEKLDLNMQQQIQLAQERDKLSKTILENELLDAEEKRRHKQICHEYQADLVAQMVWQQQLRDEEKTVTEEEHRGCLAVQEQYDKKVQVLSGIDSHAAAVHQFRRAEASGSRPRPRLSLT